MVGQVAVAGELQTFCRRGRTRRTAAGRSAASPRRARGRPRPRRVPSPTSSARSGGGARGGRRTRRRSHRRRRRRGGWSRRWRRSGSPCSADRRSSPESASHPTAGAAPMPTAPQWRRGPARRRRGSPRDPSAPTADALNPGMGRRSTPWAACRARDRVRVGPQSGPQRTSSGTKTVTWQPSCASGRGHLGADEPAADDHDGRPLRRPCAGPRAGRDASSRVRSRCTREARRPAGRSAPRHRLR